MNPRAILFSCLALGTTAGAIFFQWQNRPLDDPAPPSSPQTPAPPDQPLIASSSETLNRADAPRAATESTHAAVQGKFQRWFALKTGDTETRDALTRQLLALLTEGNTAEIIQALSPDELGTPFGTGAMELWLKIDSSQAARWLAARADASDEHALLVARRLLQQPGELLAYCDELPEGPWKQNVLTRASAEAVEKNPVAAVALAQRMKAGDARTNAFETIAYDWFGRDLAAAASWTKSIEEPAMRERLLAAGAKAIATADPDLAAGWLVSTVKTERVLRETALSIVETWADQHPAEAANWVGRFSDAGPRRAAIDLVLTHWLKTDPGSANVWIQKLPEREAIFAQLKADQAERARRPE